MTRNTLLASDSTSSHRPPKNAADTPTMTASAVATTPTMTASSRVSLMPTKSWDSTSWPLFVVPSRCAASGGCSERLGAGFWYDGSYGLTSGPMTPASTKKPSRATPALALAGRRRHWPGRCVAAASAGDSPPSTAGGAAVIGLPPVTGGAGGASSRRLPSPHARIERDEQQVHDEVGEQDREGDHEEDPLHEGVVVRADRAEQQQADPRVGEDDLHDERAGDHEAQREAEPLELGQQRVPGGVGENHPAVGEPLGLRGDHEVLPDCRDHHVAHLEHP